MSGAIEFKNSISTKEFCRLRQSVGFQKLTDEQAKKVLVVNSSLTESSNEQLFASKYKLYFSKFED